MARKTQPPAQARESAPGASAKKVVADQDFDVRVVDYNLRHNRVLRKDYDAYLDSMVDEASEGVETDTRFVPSHGSDN